MTSESKELNTENTKAKNTWCELYFLFFKSLCRCGAVKFCTRSSRKCIEVEISNASKVPSITTEILQIE
jgi:hypothetical protein